LESYLRVNLLGPGTRLIKKRIYRAAVSQRLRNTALSDSFARCSTVKNINTKAIQRKIGAIVYSSNHETARCNFMFMDSGKHSDVLRNQLRPAVRRERRGLSSSDACLKRENGRPQTVKHIQDLKLEVSPYPPCSPDLALQRYSPLLGPYKTPYVDVTSDRLKR